MMSYWPTIGQLIIFCKMSFFIGTIKSLLTNNKTISNLDLPISGCAQLKVGTPLTLNCAGLLGTYGLVYHIQ